MHTSARLLVQVFKSGSLPKISGCQLSRRGKSGRLGQLRLSWTPLVESPTLATVVERSRSTLSCVTTAMGLELYLDLRSQPCRAVYIFAKKNGIPFQMRTVDLFKGQQVSKQFSQVNCLKKVPVLKDGSFVLTERCSCK